MVFIPNYMAENGKRNIADSEKNSASLISSYLHNDY